MNYKDKIIDELYEKQNVKVDEKELLKILADKEQESIYFIH